jgi:hypothetical protein
VKFVRALNLRQAFVAVAALLMGAVSQAKADIVIDDFTQPNPAVVYSVAAPVGSTFTRVDGNRTLLVTQTQNDFGIAGSTGGLIGTTGVGGRYILNTTTGTTAFSTLTYNYGTALNLSSGGTILNFAFTSTDLNVPFSVVIGDGTNTSTQVGLVTTPTALSFNLAGFTGVNLNAVSSIQLVLNRNVISGASTTSADFSIANVTITTPTNNNAVPAPAGVILALAALPVLGLRRKFLKA